MVQDNSLFFLLSGQVFFPGLPVILVPALFNTGIMPVGSICMHHMNNTIFPLLLKKKDESRIGIRFFPVAGPPALHNELILDQLKVFAADIIAVSRKFCPFFFLNNNR